MNQEDKKALMLVGWVLLAMALFIAWLCTLTGCSLQEKKETTASTSAERLAAQNALTIKSAIEGDKRANNNISVFVSGTSNMVSVLPPNGGQRHVETLGLTSADRQNASSDESFFSQFSQHWPLWIALIGTGIGIIVVIFAVKYARKASPAIDRAIGLADDLVARKIDEVRTKLATATDHKAQAELALELARLEKERGQINKKETK